MALGVAGKRIFKKITWFFLICAVCYGAGRLYYHLTDGFQLTNIVSNLTYDERWETDKLSDEEMANVKEILSQRFTYLGKGCQSYVFASADGKYVMKFFKHCRFRPKKYLDYLLFIPPVQRIHADKVKEKMKKVEWVLNSWRITFNHLRKETGLVYVHANKTNDLNKTLTLVDKIGLEHDINADEVEFLIQKRARMLTDEIDALMAKGKLDESVGLLDKLVQMMLSEYRRGIVDSDQALMQNTGVYEGQPVHIDTGMFTEIDLIKDPHYHMQELFTSTYKFRLWLKERHPELAKAFDEKLRAVIGESFDTMKPKYREHQRVFNPRES